MFYPVSPLVQLELELHVLPRFPLDLVQLLVQRLHVLPWDRLDLLIQRFRVLLWYLVGLEFPWGLEAEVGQEGQGLPEPLPPTTCTVIEYIHISHLSI